MSAEKGWIGEDPGPQEQWHEPSWAKEAGGDGGQHFVTPEATRRKLEAAPEDEEHTPE